MMERKPANAFIAARKGFCYLAIKFLGRNHEMMRIRGYKIDPDEKRHMRRLYPNAGGRTWTTPEGSRSVAAQVATAAGLDMQRCWTATKESYLGRVPKALILDAVREAAGVAVAGRIASVKKEVMVADAAALLDGKGWLPAMLRAPGASRPVDSGDA